MVHRKCYSAVKNWLITKWYMSICMCKIKQNIIQMGYRNDSHWPILLEKKPITLSLSCQHILSFWLTILNKKSQNEREEEKETYHISTSVSLHHPPPVIPRIKSIILRFRTNCSRVEQYFCTLKCHSSSSLRKPLIPANCWTEFNNSQYYDRYIFRLHCILQQENLCPLY